MSDSESDCELVRVCSSASMPTEWDFAPDSIDFHFKVKLNGQDGKRSRLLYTLKKGVELPYSPTISGIDKVKTRCFVIFDMVKV